MMEDNRLCDILGIDIPIIQAPMAGTTTPELVSAISNAGGLGSHGCATLSLDTLASDMEQLASRTNRPVNLNFFCHDAPEFDETGHAEMLSQMTPFYEAEGVDPPKDLPNAGFQPFGAAHLDILLARPPAIISFHFGLPEKPDMVVAALKEKGCKILCSATTVAEARWLEEHGVDVIIAQGWEAGGHRGVFLDPEHDAQVGLFALLPQIVDAVSVPVVAAGGIADGRGIRAALALGASGAQIGTAFITAPEASPKPGHGPATAAGRDDSTLVTPFGSGRAARAHRTGWLDAARTAQSAPFPLMYHYNRPLQAADPDKYGFLLYGQNARMAPTGKAVERFMSIAQDAFGQV